MAENQNGNPHFWGTWKENRMMPANEGGDGLLGLAVILRRQRIGGAARSYEGARGGG